MSSTLAVSVQEPDKFNTLTQPADFPAWPFEESRVRSFRIPSFFIVREARELERKIFEITQQLEGVFSIPKTYPSIEVEQDIWVQLPPIREFTVRLKLQYLGRAKPDPLPDELLEI
jgi:hypothetical protein